MSRRTASGVTLVCLTCLTLLQAGCASDTLWQAGREWQRRQCLREPTHERTQRCLQQLADWPARPPGSSPPSSPEGARQGQHPLAPQR